MPPLSRGAEEGGSRHGKRSIRSGAVVSERALTVSEMLGRGFREMACWSAGEQRLNPPKDLPAQRGVYAFAIGERVVYVGLASRSLKQRLGFYARPAASQRTNVRLNGIISERIREGQTVRVLIAHPSDTEWNGWRISGSEGLEAALIEDFDLPWNKKGTSTTLAISASPRSTRVSSARRSRGTTPHAVYDFIAANPRCTELQIAKGVFGPGALQPRANPYCRRLVSEGRVERLPTSPASYVISATRREERPPALT